MTQALEVRTAPARQMWPLYAAGFTTAFGAHGIAANLGGFSDDAVTSLMVLGGLLALYDGVRSWWLIPIRLSCRGVDRCGSDGSSGWHHADR
ncbi:hypothetical protein [Streptomyces mirabilis]|uniref:hypothetical protein n=1 Tax=Streptomyces mirabilis TaxID=68239 RepID=UPI0022501860|nr:hypothetical protein [Streptomyces mirabilis]MCX4427121.1 hypothetical protein [Streptomyces mirabilis]